jgi:electron transfer flavoprotein alpha subunit
VLTVNNAANAEPLAAVVAPQVAAVAANYTHVFGPSTTFGKDLLPRVAALLGVGQLSDIMAIEGAYKFRRPVYAGNAIISVEASQDKKLVATVRTASFQPAAQGGSAAVEAANVSASLPSHTRFVSRSAAATGRPDLQTASRVVSGGRALGSADNFKIIFGLADKMGAGVGASRAAVDAGYAANDLQVGQTGKIIAPELYVAIGISGAIQHLTGIKGPRRPSRIPCAISWRCWRFPASSWSTAPTQRSAACPWPSDRGSSRHEYSDRGTHRRTRSWTAASVSDPSHGTW